MFIRSNLAIILRSASEKGGGDKKVKRKKIPIIHKERFHKIIELLVYVNEIRILQETYYRQKYKL